MPVLQIQIGLVLLFCTYIVYPFLSVDQWNANCVIYLGKRGACNKGRTFLVNRHLILGIIYTSFGAFLKLIITLLV